MTSLINSFITQWHRLQNWLKRLLQSDDATARSKQQSSVEQTPADDSSELFVREKIIITYHAGDIIKFDGRVLEGSAFVDESAIAGVSSPALIAAGSSQCDVLAGTVVTEGTLTVESDAPEEQNPRQEERELKHTIRVNLAILEKEIVELKRIAQSSYASTDVFVAKALLEKAQDALILELALNSASSAQLGGILGQVFEAMNKTTKVRHLLKARIQY